MRSRRAAKRRLCVGCQVFRGVEFVLLRFYWDLRTRRRLIIITHNFRHFSPLQNFRRWATCHTCRVVWRALMDIVSDPDTALFRGISARKVVAAQRLAHRIQRPLEILRDKDLPNTDFEEFFVPMPGYHMPLRLEDLLSRGFPGQCRHEYFDIGSLKSQLKFCDRNHGPACSQAILSHNLLLGFRLIDTEALAVETGHAFEI